LIVFKRIADLEFFMLVLMGLASGGMLYRTFSYPPVPASLPRLVSGITFILCLVLLVGRLSGRISASRIKGGGGAGPAWWAFSLGLFGYFVLILGVGLLPSTFLLILSVPIWVGRTTKRWLTVLIYAVVVTAAFGAAMKWVMEIPIPSGVFFK
jgi:hypothetical protein